MLWKDGDTPVSVIRVDERGFVDWRYKAGAVVTLEEGRREVELISEMMRELTLEKSILLIDIRGIKKIDRGARQLFASKEISDGYSVQALALVMGSPLSTFIGNFWLSINRPMHPTRLFTASEGARDWLQEWIGSD
jgi:hypothetical protein